MMYVHGCCLIKCETVDTGLPSNYEDPPHQVQGESKQSSASNAGANNQKERAAAAVIAVQDRSGVSSGALHLLRQSLKDVFGDQNVGE